MKYLLLLALLTSCTAPEPVDSDWEFTINSNPPELRGSSD